MGDLEGMESEMHSEGLIRQGSRRYNTQREGHRNQSHGGKKVKIYFGNDKYINLIVAKVH